MNQLQELIQKLCPNGVQFKNLKDVCTFNDGYSLKAKDIKNEGIYIVIKIGNIKNGKTLKLTDFLSELPPNIRNGQILKGGEILVAMSGSTGKTGYNTLSNAVVNQRIAILRNNKTVLNNFLRHILVNENFEKYCWKKGNGPQNNISKSDILNYIIPVPPLEVQNEIVRILDTFTSHTAELQAELQARKEQYEYYRNKLLLFDRNDENVKWMKLGEFCDILTGFPFDSSNFVTQGIRLMRGMNIKRGLLDFNKDDNRYWKDSIGFERYLLAEDDIVISMDGSLVGKSFGIITKKHLPLLLVQRVARIRTTKYNIRYVYFYITNKFSEYVDKVKTKGAIPHISKKNISDFVVPIPPLSEQRRIVSILDKFETLVNDLTEGIPAEISAVQEQYEYYRNKLLSFPKLEA